MSTENTNVVTHNDHTASENATQQPSIMGKDYHPNAHVVGYYNTGNRIKRKLTLSTGNTGIVILSTPAEAENAVKRLQQSGFDMKKLSIVGKDYHSEEHVVGYYNAGERISYWGKQGAFWGGVWGMLFGSAFFLVPGVGALVVAGPLVSAIVGGLQGAAKMEEMSALGAGLYSIGIHKDSILTYETAIKSDRFVLVVHGSTDELVKATQILKT